MSRPNLLVFCVCLLLACQAAIARSASIKVTDATGHEVILDSPAKRIIGLAPHIVENLFSAGAGDRLVGVSAWSDFPPAARDIPVVGDAFGINLEAILALEPDLVIAWSSGISVKHLERLRDLGIPVYLDEPRSLGDIARSMEHFGKLAGSETQSGAAVAAYQNRLSDLRRRFAHKKKVSVFFQVWHQPLQTLGPDHVISDVIRLCGGENSFADSQLLAPKVGLEAVLQKNPEVIVSSGELRDLQALKKQWQVWPEIKAVQDRHLFVLPADVSLRHSIRVLEGAAMMCENLQKVRAKWIPGHPES